MKIVFFAAQVLLDCSQQLIALGAGSFSPMQPLDGNVATPLTTVDPGALPTSDPRLTAIPSNEPPLVQLYKRAAVVEELASRNQEHCSSLDMRLRVSLNITHLSTVHSAHFVS